MPSPNIIRVIVCIAFCVMLCLSFHRKIWSANAYMILVYCKLSEYYSFLASMRAELIMAIMILSYLLINNNPTRSKSSQELDLVNKYLICFLLCMGVSFVFSWNHQLSWDVKIYRFIRVMILYFMINLAIDDEMDLRIFVWVFVLMFAYLAYEPMYGFLTGQGGKEHYYGEIYIAEHGVLSGHVALANNMNQMLPLAFFLIPYYKKYKKIIFVGAFLIFASALIGSKSRGGVMGFVIFCACVVYYSKNKTRNIILCSLVIVLMLLYSSLGDTADRIGGDSLWGRFTGLTHGFEMIKRGNIFGVGPGCFFLARSEYFSYRMEAHNIYGQLMGDLGIPGTVAWFYFIRQLFRNLHRAKNKLYSMSMEKGFLYRLALGVEVSLIVRLFISMASHGLYYFYWYIMAALSIMILRFANDCECLEKKHHRSGVDSIAGDI